MFRELIFILLLLAGADSAAKTKSALKIPTPEATLISLINSTLDSLEKTKGETPHQWGYVDCSKFPACSGQAAIAPCSSCVAYDPRRGTARAINLLLDLDSYKDLQIFLVSYSRRDLNLKHYHVLHFHFEYFSDSIPRYRYNFIGIDREVIIQTDEHGERKNADCAENRETFRFIARFKSVFNYMKIFRLPRGQR